MKDYLKYWRVVRYFIKAKYNLSQADLDIILFLYSEKYFSKDKFAEFDKLISWNVNRFDNLLRDGWIEVFRKYDGKRKGVYQLSYKAKRVVSSIYKKLSGEEIPTSLSSNPLFAKNVSYSDKVYRNMIKEMNEFIRQQRHLSQE
tara:strand:+ start:189 stop:620 length:432 start_codon:yes stop_codon:yes gene_type:complete